jgi:hypothetical protein
MLLVPSLLLAGCATQIKNTSFTPVASNYSDPSLSKISICRPKTFMFMALSPDMYINNELVAEISNGSRVDLSLPPGTYDVVFRHSTMKGDNGIGQRVTLRANERANVVFGAKLNQLLAVPVVSYVGYEWNSAQLSSDQFNMICAGIEPIHVAKQGAISRPAVQKTEQAPVNRAAPQKVEQAPVSPSSNSVEQRLKSLQDLHKKGLINNKDYELKKNEILKSM